MLLSVFLDYLLSLVFVRNLEKAYFVSLTLYDRFRFFFFGDFVKGEDVAVFLLKELSLNDLLCFLKEKIEILLKDMNINLYEDNDRIPSIK